MAYSVPEFGLDWISGLEPLSRTFGSCAIGGVWWRLQPVGLPMEVVANGPISVFPISGVQALRGEQAELVGGQWGSLGFSIFDTYSLSLSPVANHRSR